MTDSHDNDERSRQLEEIVAYLDGELTPQESAQVERRLASDDDYRRQLQGIERAWAALDQLPLATVDDHFAKTTMELVVDAARVDVRERTQALPVQRRNDRLKTALLATAVALLGLLAVRVRQENPNRALVADLPVIQYIDIYSQFREADFLRALHRELGDEPWAGVSAEQSAEQLQEFRQVSENASRTDWLEALSEDQRQSLRAKFNRFRALSESQQDRLRALDAEIQAAPDADQLAQTMLDYQLWLNGLPPSEQFELREMSADERVKRVTQMVARQRERDFLDLSPDELREIVRAVQPQLEAIRADARAAMSPDERDEFDSAFGRGRIWRLNNRVPPERRQEILHAVEAALPAAKRSQFAALPPLEQWQRLFGWIRQAWREGGPERRDEERRRRDEVSQQELEAFFVEEVDAATKERLLAMPRDRMQRQLREMYYGDLSARESLEPDGREHGRRGDGPPPRFDDRRDGPRREPPWRDDRRPDRGPPDGRPPRFPPQGPPGPPPPPGN